MKKFLCIVSCLVIILSSFSFKVSAASPSPQESVEALSIPETMPFLLYIMSALGIRIGIDGMTLDEVKTWLADKYQLFLDSNSSALNLNQIGYGLNSSISNFGLFGGLTISKLYIANILNFVEFLQNNNFVSSSSGGTIDNIVTQGGMVGNAFVFGNNAFSLIPNQDTQIFNWTSLGNGSIYCGQNLIFYKRIPIATYYLQMYFVNGGLGSNQYQRIYTSNVEITANSSSTVYARIDISDLGQRYKLRIYYGTALPLVTLREEVDVDKDAWEARYGSYTESGGQSISFDTSENYSSIISDLRDKLDDAQDDTLFWIQQYMEQDGQIRNLRQQLQDSQDDMLLAQSMLNQLGWQIVNGYITDYPQYSSQNISVPASTPYSVAIQPISALQADNTDRMRNNENFIGGMINVHIPIDDPWEYVNEDARNTYVRTLGLLTASTNGTPIFTLLFVSVIVSVIGYVLYGKS